MAKFIIEDIDQDEFEAEKPKTQTFVIEDVDESEIEQLNTSEPEEEHSGALKRMGQSLGVGLSDAIHGTKVLQDRTLDGKPVELNSGGYLAQMRKRSAEAAQDDPHTAKRKQAVEDIGSVEEALPDKVDEMDPSKKGTILGTIEEAGVGLSRYGASMVASALSAPVGTATTFMQMMGEKDKDLIDKGIEDEDVRFNAALIHAALGTPAEMAGNLLQINSLKRVAGAFGKSLKMGDKLKLYIGKLMQGAAGEGLEEGIQAYTEAAADVYAANPDAPVGELIDDFKEVVGSEEFKASRNESMKIGAVGGMLLPGAGVAVKAPFDVIAHVKAKKQTEADAEGETNADAETNKTTAPSVPEDLDTAFAKDDDQGGIKVEEDAGAFSVGGSTEEKVEAKTKEQLQAEAEVARQQTARDRQRQIEATMAAEARMQEEQLQRANREAQMDAAAAERDKFQQFVDFVSTPKGLMGAVHNMLPALEGSEVKEHKAAAKSLRAAHRALVVGEESIPKLKGVMYDLSALKASTGDPRMGVLTDGLAQRLEEQVDRLEVQARQEQARKEASKQPGNPSTTRGKAEREARANEKARAEIAEKAATTKRASEQKRSVQKSQMAGEVRSGIEAEQQSQQAKVVDQKAKSDAAFFQKEGAKLEAKPALHPSQVAAVEKRKAAEESRKVDAQRKADAEALAEKANMELGLGDKTKEILTPKSKQVENVPSNVTSEPAPTVSKTVGKVYKNKEAAKRAIRKFEDPLTHQPVEQADGTWEVEEKPLREWGRKKYEGSGKVKVKHDLKEGVTYEEDSSGNVAPEGTNDRKTPLKYDEEGNPRYSKAAKMARSKLKKESSKQIFDKLHTLQKLVGSRGAKIELVESHDQLPEKHRLSKEDTNNGVRVEAVWDEEADKIYFVADSLSDTKRATQVWLHEQVGHRGLLKLFDTRSTKDEAGKLFKEFLDSAYVAIRKSKKAYAEVKDLYADDLKNIAGRKDLTPEQKEIEKRRLIVEEVIARRAEKLNPMKRKQVFQKFLEFMNAWLKKVMGFSDDKVSLTMKDIDNLLEVAKNRLIHKDMREWSEFKHTDKEYKDWCKQVLVENPRAVTWYSNHQETVKRVFGKDAPLFNILLGLTSPNAKATTNTQFAVDTYLYLMGKRDKPGGKYPSNVKKALDRILSGDLTFSKNYKVDEFIRALTGDTEATTNDMWMHRAFFGHVLLSASNVRAAIKSRNEVTEYRERKDAGLLKDGEEAPHNFEIATLDSNFLADEHTASRRKLFQLAHELSEETDHEWSPREVQAAIWMKVVAEAQGKTLEDFKYDFEYGLTEHRSTKVKGNPWKHDGLTPLEYLKREAGGDPIGQLHKKFNLPEKLYSDQSELDKLYRKHLEDRGIKGKYSKARDLDEATKNLALSEGKTKMDTIKGAAAKILDGVSHPVDTATAFKEWTILTGVDRFRKLKTLEEKLGVGAEMSAYMSRRLHQSMPAIMGTILHHGKPMYNKATHWVITRPDASKGLLSVFEGMDAQTMKAVKARLVADTVDELKRVKGSEFADGIFGKGIDTDAEIAKLRAAADNQLKAGEYDKVKAHLKEYNESVKEFCRKAGIWNPEWEKAWRKDVYIPLNRVFDLEEEGVFGSQAPTALDKFVGTVKALKEGEKEGMIGDPIENLVMNYTYLIDQSLKNISRKKLYNSLKANGMVSEKKGTSAFMTRVLGNPKDLAKRNDLISIRVDGKARYYKVEDNDVFQALTELNHKGLNNTVFQIMGGLKRGLTFGVTANPWFHVRNMTRDTMATGVMKDGFIPVVDTAKGMWATLRNHPDVVEMMSQGGGFSGGYYRADNPLGAQKAIKKAMKGEGKLGKLMELSESATRVALYQNTKAQGKSSFEAAFEAKDILDFGLSGESGFVAVFTRTVPFLNARIQGLYKLAREARKDKRALGMIRKQILYKGAMLSALTLALHAWNTAHDDDEDRKVKYRDLPYHQKWGYYHVYAFGERFQIPMPFEVGAIFSGLPTAMAEAWQEGEYGSVGKFAWKTLRETFAVGFPPLMEEVLAQTDGEGGEDGYTGAPIVSRSKQSLDPDMQWTHRTSKTARGIGKLTGFISPQRLDHFINSQFATVGRLALTLTDHIVMPHLMSFPTDPALVKEDYYLLNGGMMRHDTPGYTKHYERFYDLAAEVDTAFRSWSAKDDLEADNYYDNNQDKIELRPLMNASMKQVRAINKEIDAIQLDEDMTAQEKREEIDLLILERHDIIKETMKESRSGR